MPLTPRERVLVGHAEEELPPGVTATTVEKALGWAVSKSRANAIWPVTFGLACCGIEMMATGAARFDLSRFGWEVFRATPRQADLLIVAGTVTNKMASVVKQVYDQMPEPKWVISMGTCASTGGMYNNYAVLQGIDTILPVDIYIPGCPPRPESLIYAMRRLHEQIKRERGDLFSWSKRERVTV